MNLVLDEQQKMAVEKLKNGSILQADVGTGKSRVALTYYYIFVCDGKKGIMRMPRDLYIITTAKKRDSSEWDDELSMFNLGRNISNERGVHITIDSWHNIAKYRKTFGAFFIFDEQRVKGTGKWVKSFLDIVRKNKWILLSATPGDKWIDYAPVFIANGFYRDITAFRREHVIFSRFAKYPKIEGYYNEGVLLKHKLDITVTMKLEKKAEKHYEKESCEYDRALYKRVWRDRIDPYENEPIEETGKLYYLLRKVVNSDDSRVEVVKEICKKHKKVIVFYNFTYELEMLRELFADIGYAIGEWNGEVHSNIPQSDKWAYLVQYMAGCEGWNCIETNAIIFYSQSYSYSQTIQAEGRIDRRNTPFRDLYYYKLRSAAPIDIAIERSLKQKKNFNERTFKGR